MSSHAPRVVFVTYYYSPYVSGLTLCTRALAEGLVARGWEVHVVCGHHEPATPRAEVIDGVRVHRVPTFGGLDKGIVVPGLVPVALRTAGRRGMLVPVLPLVEAAAISRVRPRNRVVPFYVCDLRLGESSPARPRDRATGTCECAQRGAAFSGLCGALRGVREGVSRGRRHRTAGRGRAASGAAGALRSG